MNLGTSSSYYGIFSLRPPVNKASPLRPLTSNKMPRTASWLQQTNIEQEIRDASTRRKIRLQTLLRTHIQNEKAHARHAHDTLRQMVHTRRDAVDGAKKLLAASEQLLQSPSLERQPTLPDVSDQWTHEAYGHLDGAPHPPTDDERRALRDGLARLELAANMANEVRYELEQQLLDERALAREQPLATEPRRKRRVHPERSPEVARTEPPKRSRNGATVVRRDLPDVPPAPKPLPHTTTLESDGILVDPMSTSGPRVRTRAMARILPRDIVSDADQEDAHERSSGGDGELVASSKSEREVDAGAAAEADTATRRAMAAIQIAASALKDDMLHVRPKSSQPAIDNCLRSLEKLFNASDVFLAHQPLRSATAWNKLADMACGFCTLLGHANAWGALNSWVETLLPRAMVRATWPPPMAKAREHIVGLLYARFNLPSSAPLPLPSHRETMCTLLDALEGYLPALSSELGVKPPFASFDVPPAAVDGADAVSAVEVVEAMSDTNGSDVAESEQLLEHGVVGSKRPLVARSSRLAKRSAPLPEMILIVESSDTEIESSHSTTLSRTS